jgi:hypothetical protein
VGAALDPGEHRRPRLLPQRDHRPALPERARRRIPAPQHPAADGGDRAGHRGRRRLARR